MHVGITIFATNSWFLFICETTKTMESKCMQVGLVLNKEDL